jgi:hypothetical protein
VPHKKTTNVHFLVYFCVLRERGFRYSLQPIILFAKIDVSEHILVLDTSILAKSNIGWREYLFVSIEQGSWFVHLCFRAGSGFFLCCRVYWTEIRCLAVGKAPMNSTVTCTSILAVGSRINGPDDINGPALQCPATVHAATVHVAQWFAYSKSSTVLCTVPPAIVFNPDHIFSIQQLSLQGTVLFLGVFLQRGTGSLSGFIGMVDKSTPFSHK